MTWRDEHRSNLEKKMEKIVKLLGDCETRLIDESDPQAKSRLKTQASELKREMLECQSDLDSIEQEPARRNLALTMANITYEDIEFVITALLNQRMIPVDIQENFQPTNPQEKMSKNGLTHKIKFLLDMGLAKSGEVRHFIENNAKINFPDVPERLKTALSTEYSTLVEAGVKGDELFMQLYHFSSHNNQDPLRQAAGLAVLCYFFETCDVFEP
jgi:hypothetical protein